jgi:plasmid stabilization system protein ParE
VVVQRILAAVERVPRFPESGRIVPELNEQDVREVIHRPYRIVYRVIQNEVHIITVHHAARMFTIEP